MIYGKIINTILKFFWPIDVFRDASKGTRLERAAAYRHNRENRVQIPGYVKNGVITIVLLAAAAVLLENIHILSMAIVLWITVISIFTIDFLLGTIYLVLSVWEY